MVPAIMYCLYYISLLGLVSPEIEIGRRRIIKSSFVNSSGLKLGIRGENWGRCGLCGAGKEDLKRGRGAVCKALRYSFF